MTRKFELWHSEEKNVVQVRAKKVGKEWMAKCPKHNDQKASLCINEEKQVYFCHGCGWKGKLYQPHQERKRLTQPKKESPPDIPEAQITGYVKGLEYNQKIYLKEARGLADKIIEEYKLGYHKKKKRFTIPIFEDKKCVNVRLYDPLNKDFKILPISKGRGVQLYPQDQLKNGEVLLCEGEWDALCAISHGIPAITSTAGVQTWKKEWSEKFRNKVIYICFDSDEVSRKAAIKRKGELLSFASEVRLIDLKLKDKEDLTDWFVTYGRTKEQLFALKEKTIEDVILEFKDFSKLKLPAKQVILNPWIKEQSIILISGWRGVGKTWLALSLLDAITRGEPFGPWKSTNPVNCLYLDGEMAGGDIQSRYKELNPKAQQKCTFYLYSEYYANNQGVPPANLLDHNWRTKIKEIMLKKKIKLWVVDNISSVTPGIDENVKKDWDPVNRWLIELRFAGISTILVHHTGKEGDQRGTSSREDNIDVSILLKRPVNYLAEEGAKFDMIFSKTRIPVEDLELIADTEFELMRDEKNKLIWTWAGVKKKRKFEVLNLFNENMKGTEIAEYLGITKGRISQYKLELRKDGYLSDKGKLTEAGKEKILSELTLNFP